MTAISRDALLAEIRRALERVEPDRAGVLMQELEYATGRDPRALIAVTPPLPESRGGETFLPPILAAVNEVEGQLPWGRRVTWHARVTPIADTTVNVLGIETEPIGDRRRAQQLAASFGAAFAPELEQMRTGAGDSPSWLFPRLMKLAPDDPEMYARILESVTGIFAPAAAEGPLPPAPAKFHLLPGISPVVKACFPERADAIVGTLWDLVASPTPRAKAIRHDGSTPGRTPREVALQLVDLMNAVEGEQLEEIRCGWSAGPASSGAIEVRAAPA